MSMLGIKSTEKLESEVKVDDDLNVNLEVSLFCFAVSLSMYAQK